MKNIIKYNCFLTLALIILVLSACNPATDIPTITLPATPPSTQFMMYPDQGRLLYGSENYTYRQVDGSFNEPVNYRGVVFAHKEYTTATPTGVRLWVTVEFTDGTVEDIIFSGTWMQVHHEIHVTAHKNPRAGILIIDEDNDKSTLDYYILVSE